MIQSELWGLLIKTFGTEAVSGLSILMHLLWT